MVKEKRVMSGSNKMKTNFSYDSFGNSYSETVSSGNVTKTVSRRMTDAKTYQFTYPDGKILRKTATGSDLDSIEYNNFEIASYSRADGVLTAVTKGQNLIETFSYNNWNMLDNHTVSNANADVYDMSYNYSRGWHLIEKADGIRNTSDKYAYDSYYRLKEVKYDFANNTAARTDNFYQDGVHNIEQSTENGITYAWGVDKLNRLRDKKIGSNTEVAYGYDERNNMISEDRSGTTNDKTYIYDDLNRLIEVKDGSQNTIATYTYDAFNRRITKTVGSTTERYTYDDWNIVEISTNSNDYANIIDSGTDRHIAIEVTANNTSTLYYFLTDERGNVTALTDESGNILERYRYRVYGDFEILNAQFSPKNCNNQTCYATNLHNFLWGGSLYEPETNLYWMRNRYYHIDMHRFINQDPIGIWGDANNLGNGFAYVAGMVIEASDPSGLEGDDDMPERPSPPMPRIDSEKGIQTFWEHIVQIFKNFFGITFSESLNKGIEEKSEKDILEAVVESRKIKKTPNLKKVGFDTLYSTLAGELQYKNRDGEMVIFTQYNDGSCKYEVSTKDGNEYKKEKNKDGQIKYYEKDENGKWQEIRDEEKINEIKEKFEKKPIYPKEPDDSSQDQLKKNFLKKILRRPLFEEIYVDPTPEWSDWKHVRTKILLKNESQSLDKDPLMQILKKGKVVNKHTGELIDLPQADSFSNIFTNANSLFNSNFNPGNIDPVLE